VKSIDAQGLGNRDSALKCSHETAAKADKKPQVALPSQSKLNVSATAPVPLWVF